MQNFGRTSISEVVGDLVVYRNLEPQDPRLPSLKILQANLGLAEGQVPRKHEPDYARVVVAMLQAAQAMRSSLTIKRLVFVGDTRLSDGNAFQNMCLAGNWQGMAYICAETSHPLHIEEIPLGVNGTLVTANRWGAIEHFNAFCQARHFPVDEQTAVILDIDKTLVGARGRNAAVIDQARVQAVEDTVAGLLGDSYQPAAFYQAYNRLNQPEFHPFTEDNQDFLAYICLVLGAGLFSLEPLVGQVKSGAMDSFRGFIHMVESRKAELPPSLRGIHDGIYEFYLAGDPTPFKQFRRNEYQRTIARFGCLEDDALLSSLLQNEIVLTEEVRRQALAWKAQGALLFALSDKPDEAALPTPELAAEGFPALHHAITHSIGY